MGDLNGGKWTLLNLEPEYGIAKVTQDETW